MGSLPIHTLVAGSRKYPAPHMVQTPPVSSAQLSMFPPFNATSDIDLIVIFASYASL